MMEEQAQPVVEMTLENALKRQTELTDEIHWLRWVLQIRSYEPDLGATVTQMNRDANVSPQSIRSTLHYLMNERIREKAKLDKRLSEIKIRI